MAAASILFGLISTANAVGGGYQPIHTSSNTQTDYIHKLIERDGKWYVTVNKIDWYEGKAADEQFRIDEPDSGRDEAPDGYYIVNNDPSEKTYEVSASAQVFMQIYDKTGNAADTNTNWNELISLSKFSGLFPQKNVLD